jgi:hypothetical protein
MATDLLPPDKTKPATFFKGYFPGKDKVRASQKAGSGRREIKERANKKGIRDGLQRGINFKKICCYCRDRTH